MVFVNPLRMGKRDVTEIAASGPVARATRRDAIALRGRPSPGTTAPLALASVAIDGWRALAERAVEPDGRRACVLQSHPRACLDATREPEELLRGALGAKKLKELRRQRHRLADHGEVRFEVARAADEVARALEIFLTLEAGGWK